MRKKYFDTLKLAKKAIKDIYHNDRYYKPYKCTKGRNKGRYVILSYFEWLNDEINF